MTQPDRLSPLSERVTALTGRTLPRDELVIVAGRAFEHQIDLDDDGQLRALLGGLSSGGGPLGGPPVSYAQPAAPRYPQSYPQAYPQPGWPGHAMAPGCPTMPPPLPPKTTRHPVGFIVGGILIVLACVGSVIVTFSFGWRLGGYHPHYYGTLSASTIAVWILLAIACVLIGASAGATRTRAPALVAAGAALLNGLPILVLTWHIFSLPYPLRMLMVMAPTAIFAVALLGTGVAGRGCFGTFGLVSAVGYGVLTAINALLSFVGAPAPMLITYLLASLFLVLFGIAVSCGRVPVGPAGQFSPRKFPAAPAGTAPDLPGT